MATSKLFETFLGRIVRDLDDIEDLKKWVKNNPIRKKEKAEERVSILERALVEPKHMMDSSRHSEQKEIIAENQNGAFAAFRKRKTEEESMYNTESYKMAHSMLYKNK